MSFIFLSSPYTHADPAVMHKRYLVVARHAAGMIRNGLVVYSPIVHGHNLAGFGLPLDHEFWMRQCLPILRVASELQVLVLDGAVGSCGVKREIAEAYKAGLGVTYIEPLP